MNKGKETDIEQYPHPSKDDISYFCIKVIQNGDKLSSMKIYKSTVNLEKNENTLEKISDEITLNDSRP